MYVAEGYSAIDLQDFAVRAMQQVVVRSTTPKDVDADAATTQDVRGRSTCNDERVNRSRSEQVDGIGSRRMP
ncbi:hypothetical protein FIBSPDRAFT_571090 [Athelia psychrophila]|uniref:Uncharacterized protein n=1 Tax=Athelia psychrophila TaxID=1759441 RepID=A0A166HSK6_9AGAM|nr:hypothetical protein FIBSPDRAFT_571090 [Fibularhizoctonia sp. CBS 109695]